MERTWPEPRKAIRKLPSELLHPRRAGTARDRPAETARFRHRDYRRDVREKRRRQRTANGLAHVVATEGLAEPACSDGASEAEHYRNALRIFPDAQSALLASSQLALAGADVAGALAPIERLGPRSAEFTADPWWRYHLGPGRDADELLRALWASVPTAR